MEDLKGPQFVVAMRTIEQDIDNVRTAIRWGTNHQIALFNLSLGQTLGIFYDARGWYLEGEALFGLIAKVLEHHCSSGETAKSPTTSSVMCIQCAFYFALLSRCQWRMGQLRQAEESVQQGLSLLPDTDHPSVYWVKSWCLQALGMIASNKNNFVDCQAYLKESIRLATTIEDRWLESYKLVPLEQNYQIMGQYDEAERLINEANVRLSSIGDPVTLSYLLSDRGRMATLRGDLETAEAHQKACLAQRQELGLRFSVGLTLLDLGHVARLQERPDISQNYYQGALRVADEVNSSIMASFAIWSLGVLAVSQADFKRAKHYFQAFQEGQGNYRGPGRVAGGPGWAVLGLGDLAEAEQIFKAVLQSMLHSHVQPIGLDALVGLAHIKAQQGELTRAVALLTLVKHHSASSWEIKEKARKLWEELTAELPPTLVTEAEARGRELDLWQTAESLLAETDDT